MGCDSKSSGFDNDVSGRHADRLGSDNESSGCDAEPLGSHSDKMTSKMNQFGNGLVFFMLGI
jgi:hypothetical protein